jgi:hypothetical protein
MIQIPCQNFPEIAGSMRRNREAQFTRNVEDGKRPIYAAQNLRQITAESQIVSREQIEQTQRDARVSGCEIHRKRHRVRFRQTGAILAKPCIDEHCGAFTEHHAQLDFTRIQASKRRHVARVNEQRRGGLKDVHRTLPAGRVGLGL